MAAVVIVTTAALALKETKFMSHPIPYLEYEQEDLLPETDGVNLAGEKVDDGTYDHIRSDEASYEDSVEEE